MCCFIYFHISILWLYSLTKKINQDYESALVEFLLSIFVTLYFFWLNKVDHTLLKEQVKMVLILAIMILYIGYYHSSD